MNFAYTTGARFAYDTAIDLIMTDDYRKSLEFMELAVDYSLKAGKPIKPKDIEELFDLAAFRRKNISLKEQKDFLFGIVKLFLRTAISR